MKCFKYSEKILDQIQEEEFSSEIQQHLTECASCKKETEILSATIRSMEGASPFISPVSPETVMAKITQQQGKTEESGSIPWLLSGLISLLGIALVSPLARELSAINQWAEYFQQTLYIVFGLLFSIFLTVYCYSHQKKARRIARLLSGKIKKALVK